MVAFRIQGLPDHVAEEARVSGRSPGYGHPVRRERASGTGPCRSCLRQFRVGEEDRLLLTYRPPSGNAAVGAPGPIFIHAEACGRYEGDAVPPELEGLPLLIEGRTEDGRVLVARAVEGPEAASAIQTCLGDQDVAFAFLRHGEAGCFIARADRA